MNKYLVIGNPIEHSLSPLLHSFWIKKHSINAIYEKQLVKKNDIEKIFNDMKENKIQFSLENGSFKSKCIEISSIIDTIS